ncbi:MAG: major facilitator superfamily 1 [Solirubrobacterales bacterium]|nr:major facilitator superfamily 1 [Solirubrobacterales bacterium]
MSALRRSFHSLAIPNYRRYFQGQVVSISGNWMQTVAEMWLVLRLTGSGVALGVATALQFTPMLLAGAYGGVLADRWPKRRLLMVTQTLMAVPALTLWALTTAGSVRLWMVYALVLVRGTVLAVDNPARQSFVSELVGPARVVNAVSLNSVIIHTGRIAGPALAGAVIAAFGVGPCFALNGLSFFVMIAALRGMDPSQLQAAPARVRARGQLRAALRTVRETPALRIPLLLMAVVGTLSFNFVVLLPLLARFTFHGGASTYAVLTAAMGVGAVVGALWNGARGTATPAIVTGSAFAFGAALLAAAAAPDLPVEIAALALVGAASVTFAASVNASLQLAVAPELRGRVMALYSVVYIGSSPLGGPLTGWLSAVGGPRAGLVLGAVAALAAGVIGLAAFARAGQPISRPALARR